MKLTFTAFTILFNLACIAQDWTPFPHNQKTWFEFSNETHYSISQYYPDSLRTDSDSTHYYFHLNAIKESLERTNEAGETISCLNEPYTQNSDDTWLDVLDSRTQDFVSIKHPFTEVAGQYFYKGQRVFDTNLKLNESITIGSNLYNDFDELHITCTAYTFSQIEVLGISDSIKVFSLQPVVEDTSLENPFKNYQYILSKDYGFVEFLPFMELIATPKTKVTLAAFEDENGELVGDLKATFKPMYEVGDVIVYMEEFLEYINYKKEVTIIQDTITSVQINDNQLTYTFNRREIFKEVLPPPPPGFPETPVDTTYYTDLQNTISANSNFYTNIYNGVQSEPINFSFQNNTTSFNINSNDNSYSDVPSVSNCFTVRIPHPSPTTQINNSELGLISSITSYEAGFGRSLDLITYTKANGQSFTPFTKLESFYDQTDTLILLNNDYHYLNVWFTGPGVDGQYFNPSLVPDSLLNQPFEITCTSGSGFWNSTQTILIRTSDYCTCDEEYEPVCGEDGNTYNNACIANCAGVEIATEISCESTGEQPQSNIYEKYPWLTSLADEPNCIGGTTISEYAYGNNFNFIHIEQSDGSSALYFQDGAFYCADGPNYSCLSAYGLANPTESWQCENEIKNPPVEETVFAQYNWLNNLVDAETCKAGSSISVYPYGNFTFVLIEDANGNSLYFEDGTFYCKDAPSYSCLQAYGLSNPTASWACENENPQPPINQTIFDEYAWLSTKINPLNCAVGHTVTAYPYGSQSFVFIEDENGGNLYYQDGTFYCKDVPGYSCVQAYRLTNPIQSWVCEEENTTETCVVDDPLNLPWLLELIASQNECGIKEIYQASREGSTYFIAKVIPCTADGKVEEVYDCKGNIICSIGEFQPIPVTPIPGFSYCPLFPYFPIISSPDIELIWSYDPGTNKTASKSSPEIQINSKEQLTFNTDLKIYPNPNNGQFTLELPPNKTGYTNMEVSNLHGKLLQKISVGEGETIKQIDLSHLPKGMYLIKSKSKTTTITQKIIIR